MLRCGKQSMHGPRRSAGPVAHGRDVRGAPPSAKGRKVRSPVAHGRGRARQEHTLHADGERGWCYRGTRNHAGKTIET